MIILPRCESPLPPEVFDPQSFIATPELLHLYMYYANPFMNWFLPQELKDLGFLTPPPRQFVRACMFFGQDNNMRRPGFLVPYSYTPGTTVAINRHCLPYLQNGEVPPPMPADLLQAALTHELSNSDFYLQDFGKVYREALEQLRIFEGLERAAPETRRLSMR
jgi:hypothetical protein